MRRVLSSLLVALAVLAPASQAATPIHPTAKQVVALNRLTTNVASLVAISRQVGQGVEVPEKQLVALRVKLVRWNTANRTTFGKRLAPATALGRQAVSMVDAIEKVETVGGPANVARVRAAIAAFNAKVVAFSALDFA